MPKRMYRSEKEKVIGGVCGGLAQYFSIDPVIFRLAFVLLFFLDGAGILAYIIAWIVIPARPKELEEAEAEPVETSSGEKKEPASEKTWTRYIPGVILIAIGTFFLLRDQVRMTFYRWDWDWWWNYEIGWEYILPGILILLGIVLLIRSLRPAQKNNSQVTGENSHESSQI